MSGKQISGGFTSAPSLHHTHVVLTYQASVSLLSVCPVLPEQAGERRAPAALPLLI